VRDRPEVSYTELEFETASDPAHPLERLVFLLDQEAENPGIPPKWLNDPIHGACQQGFLRKVKDAGLTLQTFRNPDELARLVERSLAAWKERERARQAEPARQADLAHLQRACQTTRVPFMAPDLPIGFVQRPKQFEALRALLLEGERKDPVAITTALTGAGGFGKTTLAAALCHDEAIIEALDDGILWTTLGETPYLTGALAKLHAGLTGERPAFKDAEDAATSLAERLEGKNCLVVIDDVWDPAHLEPFLRGGPSCARLITSRLLQVATDVQAQRLLVDEMSASEAVAMLTARLPGPPPDPAPFQALARALGEWPLLLRLAASAMAELVELGCSVAEALATILDDLAEGGITSWDRDSPQRPQRRRGPDPAAQPQTADRCRAGALQEVGGVSGRRTDPAAGGLGTLGAGRQQQPPPGGEVGQGLPAGVEPRRRPDPPPRCIAGLPRPNPWPSRAGPGPGRPDRCLGRSPPAAPPLRLALDRLPPRSGRPPKPTRWPATGLPLAAGQAQRHRYRRPGAGV
jgi:hypothetical protein